MKEPSRATRNIGGHDLTFEAGKLAQLAHGSVLVNAR